MCNSSNLLTVTVKCDNVTLKDKKVKFALKQLPHVLSSAHCRMERVHHPLICRTSISKISSAFGVIVNKQSRITTAMTANQ